MKQQVFVVGISLSMILALFSCKKEKSLVGKDGINQEFLLSSDGTDTFQLITYSKLEDSLVSSNSGTSLLGSYNDPVFGKVESEFYTQIRLSGLTPNFGDLSAIAIDSFVLGLTFTDYYGELGEQSFEVYELDEDLSIDSVYYAHQNRLVKPVNLIDPNRNVLLPDPINPTVIDGVEVDAQLRLYLDTNLARTMMEESENNPQSFATNEDFASFFKGLNVRVNNGAQAVGEGAILSFSLSNSLSKLTVYYRQDGQNKTFDFLMNSLSADHNHLTFDRTGSPFGDLLANQTLGQQQFYAQANVARGIIEFPGISNLPKNTVIQSARLELPVSYFSGDELYPSTSISVSARISEEDEQLYVLGVTGQYSDYTKSYILDLRDYLQQIVSGQVENMGIHVAPTKMISSVERIVFNGLDAPLKKQPKLQIVYTTY
ncbi:MAG: DUF4270 family protein [Bacteroidetes bacterium]|nr:MAG: DUF4270 family protein [Bacteroidota bacterium]